MKNLVEAILNIKAKKITRTPCNSNRASSIGYFCPELEGCLRRGVYERTRWQEKELHDAKRQLVYDEGNQQERVVLRDLAEAEIDIIEQQTAFEWKEKQITGHLDGKYVEDGVAYPVEIKSMSPFIFDTVFTFEDFKKKPWTRAYMAQITLYMMLQGIDKGIFILKNKSTGELRQITVDLDYDLGEACIKTAETINGHVLDGTLPDRIPDIQVCKDCPYKMICLPDVNFGEELKIVDDPIFEQRIDSYLKLKPTADDCGKLYETIKAESKAQAGTGDLNIICGKYRIVGKRDARGALRLSIDNLRG